MTVLGDAAPRPEREAYVGPEGLAWVTPAGVLWLAAGQAEARPVPALGTQVERLAGSPGALYAVTPEGTLRAVDPSRPDQLLWATAVGGVPSAVPTILGDAVFMVVDGTLVAVER